MLIKKFFISIPATVAHREVNTVAQYNSLSSPSKKYNIIAAKDGTFYCDCWQWKKTRTCSHIEHFSKIYHGYGTFDGAIICAIDKAVDELKHR